jgi:hypothetical protein
MIANTKEKIAGSILWTNDSLLASLPKKPESIPSRFIR